MIYEILFLVSSIVFPVIAADCIKRLYKSKLQKLPVVNYESENSYYHCIFWTMNNIKCREHLYKNIECGNNCSVAYLQTILKLLSSSELSISLCMYHLTLKQVADELIKAQNRGVSVRIITDHVTSRMEHSKMKMLKDKYGFHVRTPCYQDSYMHHKYCIIDGEDLRLRKMFVGSLNLTLQGSAANFEFVVITNNPDIICHFKDEFEQNWDTFKNSTVI